MDALSCIVHKSKAERRGRDLALRLKEVIDRWVLFALFPFLCQLPYLIIADFGCANRQLFEVAIQAAVGTKVVARET